MIANNCNLLLNCWNFLNSQFISSLLGAFFGAGFAFLLNQITDKRTYNQRQEKEKKEEIQKNSNSIYYALSLLAQLMNSLYNIKKQFITDKETLKEFHDLKEFVEKERENLENNIPHQENLPFFFKKLTLKIYTSEFVFAIGSEKLSFISSINANIILLLKTFENSLSQVNIVINLLNEHLNTNETNLIKKPLAYFEMLYAHRRNLAQSIDSSIYFAEVLFNCLNKTGKIINKEFTPYEVEDKNITTQMKPTKISSWEYLEKWAEK